MSPSTPISCLISTSGHSQAQNDLHPHRIGNVLDLIERGAEESSGEGVAGFLSKDEDGSWVCDRYSYDELLSLSTSLAAALIKLSVPIHRPPPPTLSPSIKDPTPTSQTSSNGKGSTGGVNGKSNPSIGLLCPTGLEFLVAWIGLMRMGYGVVFIAPQCSPSAVAHLVRSTSSTHLVYHPMYADLARAALDCQPSNAKRKETVGPFALVGLPTIISPPLSGPLTSQRESTPDLISAYDVRPTDISHVFHTSGTSGVPKAIPQEHGGAVGVLPRRAIPAYLSSKSSGGMKARAEGRADGNHGESEWPSESAAFTTTPLFHGGVSDLLRAWMARSVVYFYPTSNVPITVDNVLGAVRACRSAPSPVPGLEEDEKVRRSRMERFEPTSFLSVPYILSVLTEDPAGPGMDMLRAMDLVSTGGAPLGPEVGERMVNEGVRLVSRLGSSECGFLLSSHRDYATERDWEWLRNDSAYADALVFEPVDEDGKTSGDVKYEMVVTDGWKSKTKSNRPDASYATGDLYIAHPTKTNVWKYVGKGDDVLVLSNGEKASPGPIEAILSTSPLLSDVLVVGSDKDRFGVILFPRTTPPPPDLVNTLNPLIDQANAASPAYSQVSIDMCLVLDDAERISALPKSSKGTVQRGLAYEVYAKEIAKMYDGGSSSGGQASPKRTVEEIEAYLLETIARIAGVGKRNPLDRSTDLFSWGIDSVKSTVVRKSMQMNLNTGSSELPRNVVFENPSVARLARIVHDMQEGSASLSPEERDAEQYRLMHELVERYGTFNERPAVKPPLGSTSGPRTILLTGATGSLGAHLVHQISHLPLEVVRKIICLVRAEDDRSAGIRVTESLSQRGLTGERNGSDRVEAFAADLGEQRLGLEQDVYARLVDEVDVVIHAAWPVHFESNLVSFESNIRGTRHLLDLTLATTRVAHLHFCSSLASVLGRPPCDAQGEIPEIPSEDPVEASPIGYSRSKWVTERIVRRADERGVRAHILRVGQLCGDTGASGGDGVWNEKEGWPLLIRTARVVGCLPVLDEKPSWLPVDVAAGTILDIALPTTTRPSSLIYHVAHPLCIPWSTILDGLESSGLVFDRVSAGEWLDRMERSEEGVGNPSGAMLGMWRNAYGTDPSSSTRPPAAGVSCTNALAASESLRGVEPVGRAQIERMVNAWRRTGFMV